MQIEDRGGKARISARGTGWLSRLRRDVRGNTLAIVGAALVPLAGMIGSGVDMSRAYMAKTRLQSACDAAALAARRIMQDDQMTNAVRDEGIRFFNFNFNQRLYSTDTFTPVVTKPSSGTVRVTASTRIPTSIMRIFGFTTLPLNVTCDASLNFVNTDIMLVLDTTGSMLNDINDNATSTTSARKITALREAVLALYDELAPVQTQLEANGMRLRYGVVPYSSTVNVGALIRGVNASYLSDSVTYQSRVANYTTQQTSSSANGPYWEYYTSASPYYTSNMAASTSISQANCLKFMQNQAFTGFTTTPTSSGGPAPTPTVSTTFPHDGTATDGGSSGEWGWTGAPDTNATGGKSCRRKRTDTTTTYSYTYTDDTYQPVAYDTSQFKLGNPVTLATNDAGSTPTTGSYSAQALPPTATGESSTPSTWDGCIMERDTVSTIAPNSGFSIPSGAYDLNINLIPSSDATRWRPHWPDVTHYRSSWYSLTSTNSTSGTHATDLAGYQWTACPTAAVRLTAWTRGNMEAYVNSLVPDGYTYHDIGMLWGARLISSGGIFADSPDTYNSMPVSRHIIFMTDGMLNTQPAVYGAYGVEGMEHRVSGGSGTSDLTERHRQRFRMICNSAKSMNISIWVVAFASTLENSLVECASNANQASTSANRDQLVDRFRQIGSQIGALRLTQ